VILPKAAAGVMAMGATPGRLVVELPGRGWSSVTHHQAP
jgi:hypothetical protein